MTNSQTCEVPTLGKDKMDIVYRLYIPDNVEHWKIFQDDSQVERFMNNLEEFEDLKLDWPSQESIYGEFELVELEEGNRIPYGLAPLEKFIDQHDRYKVQTKGESQRALGAHRNEPWIRGKSQVD
jgi:hypothetical protein